MPRYKIHVEFADEATSRVRTGLKLMGARSVRIEEVKTESKPLCPDTKPTSPEAIRVASLFGRSPDREWSDAEKKAFMDARRRGVMTLENISMCEKYYAAERKKGDDGIHRRDLLRFCRHFDGEADRARAAVAQGPVKSSKSGEWHPSNVVQLPQQSEEEQERLRLEAKELAAQFRAKHGRGNA